MENKTTIITAMMSFETTQPEELQRCLDHHMEYLIDFDENADIINSVEGVISYDINNKYDKNKLQMIANILADIFANEPSDEELDNDDNKIALYDELHNLKEALADNGIYGDTNE